MHANARGKALLRHFLGAMGMALGFGRVLGGAQRWRPEFGRFSGGRRRGRWKMKRKLASTAGAVDLRRKFWLPRRCLQNLGANFGGHKRGCDFRERTIPAAGGE